MTTWFRPLVLCLSAAASILPAVTSAAEADPRMGTWVERKGDPSYQGIHRAFAGVDGV